MSRYLGCLLLFWSAAAVSQTVELPSFGESVLAEQFPEYQESSDVERGLRRYRSQLEHFREEVLEGFNRGVMEYRQKLVETDAKLELDRKKGRISKEDYLEQHDYIAQELKKSNRSGEHMKAYFTFLGKYKSESRWVIEELAREEKKKFRF